MTKFYEEIIGPDEASRMLSRNYDNNRKVNRQWVNQLADMMRHGEFVAQNGDVIRIGRNGTLYDGQHRLHAVIESGTTHIFDVAVIDDADSAFLTMDNGTRRPAATYVHGGCANLRASIARIATCIENGTMPLQSSLSGRSDVHVRPSRISIANYANNNMQKMDYIVRKARSMGKSIGAGPDTAYGIFIELVLFCGDHSALDAFIDDCCATVQTSSQAAVFVSVVRKRYLTTQRKPATKDLVIMCLLAYDYYVCGKPLTPQSFNGVNRCAARYDALLQTKRAELRGEE